MADETKLSPAMFPRATLHLMVEEGDDIQMSERRAIALARACEGITTDALEAGLLSKALDLLAAGFLTDDCDGSEEGCPSCEARRLLRALGRIA
jgi:hypothetical protein